MATFHIDSILAPKDQQIIPTTIYVHMTEGSSTSAMGAVSRTTAKGLKITNMFISLKQGKN